jgi:uncharacterized protein (TIGR03435 family)
MGLRSIGVASFVSILLVQISGYGQSTSALPKFEAGIIKVNKSGDTRAQGSRLHGGQLAWQNLTLKAIMGQAFISQFVGGPSWLDDEFIGAPNWIGSDRFDLRATSPQDTSVENVRLMLQGLLFDRFKLAIHRETKLRRVMVLTVDKQGNLRPSTGSSSGEKGCVQRPDPDSQIHYVCTGMTMGDLAETLPRIAPLFFNGPCVDMTGLTGTFDLKLDWLGRVFADPPAPGAAPDPGVKYADRADGSATLFNSLEKLGLKLQERRQPYPTIVIDHLERTPSEN